MTHPGSPFWVPSRALQAHLNRTVSGSPDDDWLSMVRARHLACPLERTLVIGCGGGHLERALARKEAVGRIAAVDADADQVARAREQADRVGLGSISYSLFDPERGELPAGPWDAVFAQDVLHHVSRLGELLARIGASLSPRGRFVMAEYVGPARFQYSDERMDLVARYFRLLPDRLRRDPASGRLLWRRDRMDADRLARETPAEAARGVELLAGVRRMFDVEAEYPGGQGLLHPLLSGLARNFGVDPAGDERVLEVLCAAEARLFASGRLDSPFAFVVGRRRSAEP
jgi:SAM-dependent methyltransferase